MRHFVLTRSAYSPGWSRAENERRLELLRGVTARCLAKQTRRDFVWVVLLDRRDPLLEERKRACASAAVPLAFRFAEELPVDVDRRRVAARLYRADWLPAGGSETLTTRLDDDDGLAPDFLDRVRLAAEAAAPAEKPLCWLFPNGVRIWGGRQEKVRHETNAWVSVQGPSGECVYDWNHKRIGEQLEVRVVDERLAWLWVRHEDTLSRHRVAGDEIDVATRRLFPAEWDLLQERSAA